MKKNLILKGAREKKGKRKREEKGGGLGHLGERGGTKKRRGFDFKMGPLQG